MNCFPEEQLLRFRAEGQWGDVTLGDMFQATCARVPDRIGLIDAPNRNELVGSDPKRLTYGEMAAEVDRYAALLQGQGIRQGSIVATQLPNIAEMILIYLAVTKVGAILSPISMAYRSAELVSLSETAPFDAFISNGRFKGQPHYEERMGALPAGIRVLGIGDDLPENVARLDGAVPAIGPRPVETSADDLFAIFWTSGTEGSPKAVPKTHNNMMASSLGAWRILDLPDGANVLAPFPFVNAAAMGGLMMCWMRTAGALILHHPFDIATFLRQLTEEDISYTMVAPTLLVYLRDKASNPELHPALHRMRAIGTGAAPPDPEVFAFFQDHFAIPVLNFFGSNEGAQLCSAPGRVPDPRRRARYFPRDGDENWPEGRGLRTANGGTFKLIDPASGAIVTEPGQVAEMYLRGPAMMPGYYTPNGFARSGFDAEGFFATADLFEISECGSLIRFQSRTRELIVRGGMKISPVELDGFLSSLPGVREVAVAAYADVQMGEKVCLFAVMEQGRTLDLDAVCAFCDREGLAKFKWPERLVLCDALPRTPLAKLDRKALTRRLAAEAAANNEEAIHA